MPATNGNPFFRAAVGQGLPMFGKIKNTQNIADKMIVHTNSRGAVLERTLEMLCHSQIPQTPGRRAPGVERRAPGTKRRAPRAGRQALNTGRSAPGAERRVTGAERCAPSVGRWTPSAVC